MKPNETLPKTTSEVAPESLGESGAAREQQVWAALHTVMDPELPIVSLVELGVVRRVELEGTRVRVTITPTFSGCPALGVMRGEVRAVLSGLGFESTVHTELSPPWSSDAISESAREKLKAFGVAPPQKAQAEQSDTPLISFESAPTPCPYCDSLDTTVKNTFGATLCKAILYCHTCQQPFEKFKTI